MDEVFIEAVRPINLPLTVLLAVVVGYWLLVALGAFTLDLEGDISGDGDLNGSHDGDLDGGHDGDAHHDGGAESGLFSSLLHFVNVGEVPMTIVGSILVLCMWLGSMMANHYWTGGSFVLGLAALLPILIVSAILTRYLTLPFKPLMRAMNREGDEHIPVVGRTCEIVTSEANAQFGQARIDTKGSPILLNVRVRHGDPLPRGASCLVVAEHDGIYDVVPVTPENLG